MALICEKFLIYDTNKAINILLNITGFLAKGLVMCFLMCSHFSKILFAVYRQKADCSTSMLNAFAYHFLRYKSSLMVVHDCDTSHHETSA